MCKNVVEKKNFVKLNHILCKKKINKFKNKIKWYTTTVKFLCEWNVVGIKRNAALQDLKRRK